MALSYKNHSTDSILNKLRDIRYGSGEMLYGQYNIIERTIKFSTNISQLTHEADLFSREMLSHRSKIDFKRILGQHQDDWCRQLHEAFVYDRCRAIYYGLNLRNIDRLREGKYSFPGHILLFRFLNEMNYNFSTSDSQPFFLYLNIEVGNQKELLDPIFEVYPDLRDGLSTNDRNISYVNTACETVLNGLYNSKVFMNTRGKNLPAIFEIRDMTDENIEAVTLSNSSNPILNSLLNEKGDRFMFINTDTGPGNMRFNESLFITRSLGFIGKQLEIDENVFYAVSRRDSSADPLTKNDLYAITGIKTDLIPYTDEQIKNYLGINTYKERLNGGNEPTPFTDKR